MISSTSPKVQIQVDSIGAMTQLSEDAFSGQHVWGPSHAARKTSDVFLMTLAIKKLAIDVV